MAWVVEPNTRIRARAPKAFQPPVGRPRHDVMAAFRAYQVQYIDRLRQANGLDLARARVASPAARWIRMPLGSGFAMMIAHERRHLQQARRVIEKSAFPKSVRGGLDPPDRGDDVTRGDAVAIEQLRRACRCGESRARRGAAP